MAAVHVFTDDDALGTRDAVGVAAAIRSGEISAAEATAAAIARAERLEQAAAAINPIVTTDYDRAQKVAARIDASSDPSTVFRGVPTFLKDNIAAKGLPMWAGSVAFRTGPEPRDDVVAAQFRAQGVVVLGKSTLPEFGLTATTEFTGRPPTRNPWNPDYSVGASSGGSAALVASGVVPIAHANDGGGSIRIPAAAAGLVGLKPTRARHRDRPFIRSLPVSLVVEGALTRTVRDTATYLAGMERVAPAPELPPIGTVSGPAERRLRIALLTDTVVPSGVSPAVVAVARAAAESLAAEGHTIVEVTPAELGLTDQFREDFILYWGLLADLLLLGGLAEHPGKFDPRKTENLTRSLAKLIPRHGFRLPGAISRLRHIAERYNEWLRTYDVMLSPVLSQPTVQIGHLDPTLPFPELMGRITDCVGFTPLNNVSGAPAISVPFGFYDNGLPASIHLAGGFGDERTLLQLAYEIEAKHPFPLITAAPRITQRV